MELETKINNTSIVNLVIDKITKAMINGELKPGDKLPTEQELVESLGVGRYSIREAVKMLVAQGVLEIKRADGTYVVESVTPQFLGPAVYSLILSQKNASDLHDLRVFFERMLLELAVQRADVGDLKKLEEWFVSFESNVSTQTEYEVVIEYDTAFHRLVAAAAKSTFIENLYDAFFKIYVLSLQKLNKDKYIKEIKKHHKKIFDMIKTREKDVTLIKNIVEESLKTWISNTK